MTKFIICFIAIVLLTSAGFIWALESGNGLYVVFFLIGLYALCGLGNMLNNLQRDKYLRELNREREE